MELVTVENAGFFTQQLFLIGTRNEDGTSDFAPISWVSYTAGPPSCLVISISGQKRKKQTSQNIERTRQLSATIVTPDLLPFAEQHNRATQRDIVMPHIIEPGRKLDVPLIQGAAWSYECELIEAVQIGQCDTYFAAFRQINVREDIQNLDFYDLRAINPVIYSPEHYFTVGDHRGEIGDYAK